MLKLYASFSVKHPVIHAVNLLIVNGLFFFCCYQLIENEKIEYAPGLLVVMVFIVIFAKAADYRTKYLTFDK